MAKCVCSAGPDLGSLSSHPALSLWIGPRSRVIVLIGVQPERKDPFLNLKKPAQSFAYKMGVCSEERAVAGLSSL